MERNYPHEHEPESPSASLDLTVLYVEIEDAGQYILGNAAYCRTILEGLAKSLELLCTSPPTIVPYNVPSGEIGYTIFQPLSTSYIVLDTWPEEKRCLLSIASCKPFDLERTIEITALLFSGDVYQAIGRRDGKWLVF